MRIKQKANKETGGKLPRLAMFEMWSRLREGGGEGDRGDRGEGDRGGGGEGGVGARATRSRRKNTGQKIAGSCAFNVDNVLRAIEAEEPALFDVCDMGIDMIEEMKGRLRGYTGVHRTTTNSRATMAQIFDNVNGLDRIEEGVHDAWACGSADEMVDLLFGGHLAMRGAWETLKSVRVFPGQKTSPVMMVSGDSRKIIERRNHGGVHTGRELQVTPCHFDDVHNLSLCLWGTKTFLLARFGDVECGPAPEINLNRVVDTRGAAFTKYVLRAGQALYLPPRWWHEVDCSVRVREMCESERDV
jgi:hypothetical protein